MIFPIDNSHQAPTIGWHAEDVALPDFIDTDCLEAWIINTIATEELECGEISIIFCSDDYLLEVNGEHLDHDYYTDIITFEYCQSPVSGDLFISLDRVRDNADQLIIEYTEELHRVIIHGVLHLCGHGDKDEISKNNMRALENKYLSSLTEIKRQA